jgi:hypothetical protein
MKYTPETLAALLNGREYGSEITREDTLMTTQSCGELFMKRFVATAVGSSSSHGMAVFSMGSTIVNVSFADSKRQKRRRMK